MSRPRLIFGAGGIGTTKKAFTYTWDSPEKVTALLKLLQEHGIVELDSAASYPPGNPWNTETLLGQTELVKEFVVDTKVMARTADGCALSTENIEKSVSESLRLLGLPKVRTLHAHMPDQNTPLEETAAGFHAQYVKGRFERLGLCNFSLEQLQTYVAICEEKGYVKPTVVQDQYNAISRFPEQFLPFMRQHGMIFVAYSPLAGGFLTGKVTLSKDPSHPDYKPLPPRTRWAGESAFDMYTNVFDNEQAHSALRSLHDACMQQQMTVTEASLRWLAYHSQLTEADGLILGATREEQLLSNLAMIEKGPLPEDLVNAVNEMHERANVGDMFGGKR